MQHFWHQFLQFSGMWCCTWVLSWDFYKERLGKGQSIGRYVRVNEKGRVTLHKCICNLVQIICFVFLSENMYTSAHLSAQSLVCSHNFPYWGKIMIGGPGIFLCILYFSSFPYITLRKYLLHAHLQYRRHISTKHVIWLLLHIYSWEWQPFRASVC